MASSVARFVRAGPMDLMLAQRIKVAVVEGTVMINIEIGRRPRLTGRLAGLGAFQWLRELSFEALDFGLVPGGLGAASRGLEVGNAVLEMHHARLVNASQLEPASVDRFDLPAINIIPLSEPNPTGVFT